MSLHTYNPDVKMCCFLSTTHISFDEWRMAPWKDKVGWTVIECYYFQPVVLSCNRNYGTGSSQPVSKSFNMTWGLTSLPASQSDLKCRAGGGLSTLLLMFPPHDLSKVHSILLLFRAVFLITPLDHQTYSFEQVLWSYSSVFTLSLSTPSPQEKV